MHLDLRRSAVFAFSSAKAMNSQVVVVEEGWAEKMPRS